MNYSSTIHVQTNQQTAFGAVALHIVDWWGKVDKHNPALNDEFSVFFGTTEWRFRVQEFDPPHKIVWRCVKAHHEHDGLSGITEEWLNTTVTWTFESMNKLTHIHLLHDGLLPHLNCYEVCEAGWDFFTKTSLKAYLETGTGSPYQE